MEDEVYAFDSSGMYDPCSCRKKIKYVVLTVCVFVLFLVVVTTELPHDYDDKKSLNNENQFDRIRVFVLELKDGMCEWARTIFAMIMQTFAAFNDPPKNTTSTNVSEYRLNHSSDYHEDDDDEGILPFLMTNDTGMMGTTTTNYIISNSKQEQKKRKQANKKRKKLKKQEEKLIDDGFLMTSDDEEGKEKDSAKNLPAVAATVYDLDQNNQGPESLSYKHASVAESLFPLNPIETKSKSTSPTVTTSVPTQKPTQRLLVNTKEGKGKTSATMEKPTAAPTQEPTQRLLMQNSMRKSGTLVFESSEEKASAALFSLLPTWFAFLFLVVILLLGFCFTFLVHSADVHGQHGRRYGSDILYGIVFVPVVVYTCGRYCSNAIRRAASEYYQISQRQDTDHIDVAYEEILSVVRQHGGYVESTRETTGNLTSKKEISITVKCPESNFEPLFEHVKHVFQSVNSRSDCSAFVLVESNTKLNGNMQSSGERRRNLRQIEQRYYSLLKFMDKSETITEALAIQKELAQMEEQMDRLKQQSHMYEQAVLTITLTENANKNDYVNVPSDKTFQVKRGRLSKMQSMQIQPQEENCEYERSNGNNEYQISMESDIDKALDLDKPQSSSYGDGALVLGNRRNSDDCNGYKLRLGSVYIDARATVRIAIYDTVTKTFREQTSGFVANKELGLIVTCAHLIVDPTTLIEKYQVAMHGDKTNGYGSRFFIVVGVLRDEREAPAWKFTAKVLVKGNKANHATFVDALVLQATGIVHSQTVIPTNELEMDKASGGHSKSVFKSVELRISASFTQQDQESLKKYSELLPAMLPMGVSAKLHVNDPVYFLGFPSFRGETICCDSAVINQLDQKFINCTAFQHAGSSGGPLINRHGEVIGIMSKGFRPGDFGQHLAIDWVYPLVKEAEERCKYYF